ncbi:MAG TPA: FecR family protein, partial [Rhodocyclaceae bacterium]|nr:FecR family protein [Rhodocyclaceae bacterium]
MKTSLHLALITLILPLTAWGQAGDVRFAQGDVQVQRANGSIERPVRGTKLNEGDTLITGSTGTIQITMVDQAVLAVRPNTRLKLETYRYSGTNDESDKSILSLIRGGFRSITGLIGKKNMSAYSVRTPTATIGIRGTDHEPLVIPVPGPGETPIGEPGTYDKVNSGSTVIETSGGLLIVQPNQ